MHAATRGDYDIVNKLLDAGANADLQNNLLETASSLAERNSHNHILSLLSSYKKVTKYKTYSAMILACQSGNLDILRFVIKNGVDVNTMSVKTALMYAAQYGHEEIVSELIKAGAKIDLKTSPGGSTALMFAALAWSCASSLSIN